MNEQPPSSREGGSDQPAYHDPAARDEASADSAHPAIRTPPGASFTAAPGAEASPEPDARFPWPPAGGDGFITAGARTWIEVMFSPASFFRRMPRGASLGPALVYFLIVSVLGAGIQLFWSMVALTVLPPPAEDTVWAVAPASASEALVQFFLAPGVLLVVLFVGGAITHALLKLFGGAGERYGTTVRVFAYAQSPQLLVIVPVLGAIAAFIWGFILAVVGLREAHRTTTTKAALAILLPVATALFLLFMAVLFVVVGAAMLVQ